MRSMADEKREEQDELDREEVDDQDAELLPDREAMSVICPDPLAGGVDPALPTE